MILLPDTLFDVSDCGHQQKSGSLHQRTNLRDDLYYRLKVIHIHTPALREVPDDIPGLANHFLNKYCGYCKQT